MHIAYVQFWCFRFSGIWLSYYSEQQINGAGRTGHLYAKKLNLKLYPAAHTKINLKWIWLSQISQASADCPIWEKSLKRLDDSKMPYSFLLFRG